MSSGLLLPRMMHYGTPVNRTASFNRGLVSWWKVLPKRYGGLRWLDLAGRNHGVLTSIGASSATGGWGATSRPGGYGELRFDGTNDTVIAPAHPSLNISGDFTLAAWIFMTDVTTINAIISKDNGNSGSAATLWDYDLFIESSGANQKITLYSDGTTPGLLNGTSTVSANVWHHVAVSRISGTLFFYLDGKGDGSGSYTGTLPTSSFDVHLGNDYFSTEMMTGSLDEVRIHNVGLLADEIWQLYRDSRLRNQLGLNWTRRAL